MWLCKISLCIVPTVYQWNDTRSSHLWFGCCVCMLAYCLFDNVLYYHVCLFQPWERDILWLLSYFFFGHLGQLLLSLPWQCTSMNLWWWLTVRSKEMNKISHCIFYVFTYCQFQKVFKDFTFLAQQTLTFVIHLQDLSVSQEKNSIDISDAEHDQRSLSYPSALPVYRIALATENTPLDPDPKPPLTPRSKFSMITLLCGVRLRR